MADEKTVSNSEHVIPRKTGVPRFFELLGRDLWSFYKASLLCCLAFLPGAALAGYGLLGPSLPLTLLGGLLAGALGAPFLCGMIDTVLRALRDEPGYWWLQYKRALKLDWKESLVPGALFGLLLSLWLFLLRTLPEMEDVPTSVWVCVIVGAVMLVGFFSYMFAQVAAVSLPLKKLIKNSGLFFVGALPRTLASAIVQCVYWALVLGYLPFTVPVLVVTGFWLPVLISLMILYPPLERSFHLEETIGSMRDAELSGDD